jgi:hypothetical protein
MLINYLPFKNFFSVRDEIRREGEREKKERLEEKFYSKDFHFLEAVYI